MPLDVANAQGAMTGARFRASLQDGRKVYLNGQQVEVTTHPAFAGLLGERLLGSHTQTDAILGLGGVVVGHPTPGQDEDHGHQRQRGDLGNRDQARWGANPGFAVQVRRCHVNPRAHGNVRRGS